MEQTRVVLHWDSCSPALFLIPALPFARISAPLLYLDQSESSTSKDVKFKEHLVSKDPLNLQIVALNRCLIKIIVTSF